MDQLRLGWDEPIEPREQREVTLDRESTEAALALMVRALVAVVRAVRETDDER